MIYLFGPGTDNGYQPMGQLLLGPGGVLYGTTSAGGACNGSTVFQLTPSTARVSPTANAHWAMTKLHEFGCGGDGLYPYGGVIADAAGNLYGTTSAGAGVGCQGYGRGTVYKLMHSNGVWTSSIVYNFQGPEGDGIP